MSDYKLQIKDGNGDGQELYVDSGSQGLVPYHKISGSVSAVISNFPATQSVAFATSSALTASILNLPATQSVSLVNTGSLTASLSAADITTLTASISAVSSAVAHSLDKFIAGILDNGSSSFNVDIVAGDVNTLTQSIGYVKDEVAKLTALSSSDGKGLLIYASESNALPVNIINSGSLTASVAFPATQSVSLVNTASLTASVSVSNWPGEYKISSSALSPVYITASSGVSVTGAVTSYVDYATSTGTNVFNYTELTASSNNYSGAYKGYIITNHTNHYLYILVTSYPVESVTTSSFTYVIDPYSTYESMAIASNLKHSMILHPSVSAGLVTRTILQ